MRTALFECLFGDVFQDQPLAWQRFHKVTGTHTYRGEAEVIQGEGWLMRGLAALLRLPPTSIVPVQLIIEAKEERESWSRQFGDSFLVTEISLEPGRQVEEQTNGGDKHKDGTYLLLEKFGPLCFGIVLSIEGEKVYWDIVKWWFLGVRLPGALAPLSQTTEYIDDEGRYAFDIDISVRFCGRLIAYRGWLMT